MRKVVEYLKTNIKKINALEKSDKPEDRVKYANFSAQINKYIIGMDDPTAITFLKIITDPTCRTAEGGLLYSEISRYCTKDALKMLAKFSSDRNGLK